MKYKTILLILATLILSFSVNAAEDCSIRGNVVFTADKYNYMPGESFDGVIKIVNNHQLDSTIIYSLKLVRDRDAFTPLSLTERRTIPPGNSTYKLFQIFRAGFPQDATTGKWFIQLNAGIDTCIYQNTEVVSVSTCSDGILNGEEEGVDCGGQCKKACVVPKVIEQPKIETPPPVSTSYQDYIIQKLPFQLPENFFLYLTIIVLLLMIIMGASIIYWKRRARFSKFY